MLLKGVRLFTVFNNWYYMDALEGLLGEVALIDWKQNEKRYAMYKKFTVIKYGALGSKQRGKLDECVQELIVNTFPVEHGKRKRGFESLTDQSENHD